MNSEHPDEITLLRLAFPRDGMEVSAHWAHHVLHCPQCASDILNMREMATIFGSLEEERPKASAYPGRRMEIPSSADPLSDMPAAAFSGCDSDMSEVLIAGAIALTGLDDDAVPDVAAWLDSESEELGLDADAGADEVPNFDEE